VRVLEDVPEGVREAVARALGDEQRSLVEDAHEARGVATRTDVARRVTRRRGDEHERCVLDESACEAIDPVARLRTDDRCGLAKKSAEGCFVVDGLGRETVRHAIS